MIFARKMYKIPEFYVIFARKMPEFYVIILNSPKNIYPNFRGARTPRPQSRTPMLLMGIVCLAMSQGRSDGGISLFIPPPKKISPSKLFMG